jgi:acetolactate decarboxylase
MQTICCTVPDSLAAALRDRIRDDHTSCQHVVASALGQYLAAPIHTLFQVSTSAALVEGLYQGAVRVSRLLEHGDFGLGTFIDLDGEMVVLDGVCYRVTADGRVARVDDDPLVPYAVVTRFAPEVRADHATFTDFAGLEAACDALRGSDNLFHAFRVRATFTHARARVMCAVHPGTHLGDAAGGQAEFDTGTIAATLVGLWAPAYAGAFCVPGYHFHILSDDLRHGGHLLDCAADVATIECCAIADLHVALPETEAFLRADLGRDPQAELARAERRHEPNTQGA